MAGDSADPETYTKFVLPKYKVASCSFRKGGSSYGLWLYILLLLAGIIFISSAIPMIQPLEDERDPWTQEEKEVPNPMADFGTILLALGITALLIALPMIFVTLMFSSYRSDIPPSAALSTRAGYV